MDSKPFICFLSGLVVIVLSVVRIGIEFIQLAVQVMIGHNAAKYVGDMSNSEIIHFSAALQIHFKDTNILSTLLT